MKKTNELLDTLNRCLEYMESREDVIDGETPSPNKEMILAIELREAVGYLEKQEKMNKGSLRLFISELKKEFPETDLDYIDFAADRFIEQNPDAFFNEEQAALLALTRKDEEHDREMEGFKEWYAKANIRYNESKDKMKNRKWMD